MDTTPPGFPAFIREIAGECVPGAAGGRITRLPADTRIMRKDTIMERNKIKHS